MGVGGIKKFFDLLKGLISFAACEGMSKKFEAKNFQLPGPHQSRPISEHSLNEPQTQPHF